MSARRVGLLGSLLAAAALAAACGGPASQTAPSPETSQDTPTTTALPTSATPSTSPAPDFTATGIVVHECKIGGDLSARVVSYNPVSGKEQGSTSFTVGDTSGKTRSKAQCSGGESGHDNGRKARSAFNEDFTQLFVEVDQFNPKATVIGYYDTAGKFNQISRVTNEFANVVETDPAYHVATRTLYYWIQLEGRSRLMSRSLPAGSPQFEDALQKPLDFSGNLYVPLTDKPVMDQTKRSKAYNKAGTKAVEASGASLAIGPAGEPIKLANDTPEVVLDKTSFRFDLIPVGFAGDSVIVTDQVEIFRVDVNGQKGAVKKLFTNANVNTKLGDVTLSSDGTRIAFLANSGGESSLYVMPVAGGQGGKLLTTKKEIRILQFN